MNKSIKIALCYILICFMISSLGCGSQYLGGNRSARWKKDLNYLKMALPRKHINLFFKISEKRFDDEIDNLRDSVDKLNDDEITAGIYEIAASIGDSHTSAYKKSTYVYPIQFYCFKEGIYVINTSNMYKKALYSKLVKINGIDISKVQKSILPLIVDDNESMIKKSIPKYLMNAEILHGIKISSDTKKSIFTFEDSDGKDFDLNVESVNIKTSKVKFAIGDIKDASKPLYMQNSNLNYWYRYISDKKTLYFKYNECENDEKSKNIEEFIKEMLKFMDTHDVRKFVIDMRDNSGGSDKYLNPIIDWLKGKKINDRNHLFVIVGRNTFSSAVVDAEELKKETNAFFVGEETSGKPNHYGAVKSFMLPNSKIEVQYSTQYNKTSNVDSDTFLPDKVIEPSIKDYLNKKDPVLDYILLK